MYLEKPPQNQDVRVWDDRRQQTGDVVGPSGPARGGYAPTHLLMRVLPPRVLLENGTEEAKSECGRLPRRSTLRVSSGATDATCHKHQNGQRPFWCQLVKEVRNLRHRLS